MVTTSTEVVLYEHEAALRLTQSIRQKLDGMDVIAADVAPLLADAKEHEAWRSMGYQSWEVYVAQEFQLTRRQSYRLLDQAEVVRELSEAVGEPVQVRERAARAVKGKLTDAGIQARKHKDAGMGAQAAVDTAVAETRTQPITRSKVNDGAAQDFERYDEGAMIVRCKHCNTTGAVGERFELVRAGTVPGAADTDGVERVPFED